MLAGDYPGGPVAKGLPAPSAGDPSSIPGQGTRSHMPQPNKKFLKSKKKKKSVGWSCILNGSITYA